MSMDSVHRLRIFDVRNPREHCLETAEASRILHPQDHQPRREIRRGSAVTTRGGWRSVAAAIGPVPESTKRVRHPDVAGCVRHTKRARRAAGPATYSQRRKQSMKWSWFASVEKISQTPDLSAAQSLVFNQMGQQRRDRSASQAIRERLELRAGILFAGR